MANIFDNTYCRGIYADDRRCRFIGWYVLNDELRASGKMYMGAFYFSSMQVDPSDTRMWMMRCKMPK